MSGEPIDCDEAPILRYFRESGAKPETKHFPWAFIGPAMRTDDAECCGNRLVRLGTLEGSAEGYLCRSCGAVYTLSIDPPAG